MFSSFYVQKVLYSEGPKFRRSYVQKIFVQKVLYSGGSNFKRSYIQKVLYSENSLFHVRKNLHFSCNRFITNHSLSF